jgi:Domain of unknown function (DUF927)
MKPLEFLAAVLPPAGDGYYCLVELTKKKEHLFVKNLEDAELELQRWNEQNYDTYFALGTYKNSGKRVATNVEMVKCIAVDVDCNHKLDLPDKDGIIKQKAYPSAKLGFEAIMRFSEEVGLSAFGDPWFVHSGGGVHAYWPLEEAVPVSEWKPVAEQFKRLCFEKKLGIDATVTGDASRIMRVPGTTNTGVKNNAQVRGVTQVRFMNEGAIFKLQDIKDVVQAHLVGTAYEAKPIPPANVIELPGTRPTAAPLSTAVKLFENSVTKFQTLVEKTQQGKGCGQLAYYCEHAAEDGMEPLWRGLLSIAQKCEEADEAVVWLSQMHPYDEERMHTKLREIKGPYPCTKFDSENPGICTSCQHWGKITNPLILGREYAVETVEKTVEVKQEKVLRPEPPRGYAYGTQGGVFAEREDEDADGKKLKRQILLTPYDLFPVDILNVNGEHTVHMMALRPTGPQTVKLPQKAVVSKDETVKHLANQNILAAFGVGNDKNLFEYVRASVEKMSAEKAPITVPSSFGWQEDDTFVFAGKIYSRKGAVAVPMEGLENLVMHTQPRGNIENWRAFINLLIKKRMYKILAIILAGAAAPLMRFTGIYGLTYHCGSTESGTGKSLALEGAASIWGHPVHYRTGKNTSPIAMQQRLGLLKSLPLITDEITSKNRENFEWFASFLLDMTEGKGKERMEAGANKERLNLSVWMALAIMSSNTHVVDFFGGDRKHAAEGELRRVLEFVMSDVLHWQGDEVEIIKLLPANYGIAGEMMIQFMVNNLDELKETTPQIVKRMYKEFGATNDERFWMAGIGAQVAAALVMGNKKAGIVDFPLEPIMQELSHAVNYMRGNIRSTSRTAEDVLNAYTREYYGNFIIIKHDTGSVLAALGNGDAIDASTARSNIMGRVEHGATPGHVDYFIEERLLKSYCSSMSFGFADFKRQLEKVFTVSYMARKDLMAKTKGPQMRVSVVKISRRIDDDEFTHQLPLVAA